MKQVRVTVRAANHADRQELLRSYSKEDQPIMSQCLQASYEVWIGRADGVFACGWGLVPPSVLSNQAYLWLRTSEVVAEYPFVFIRHAQRAIEQALQSFDMLTGHCVAGQEHSIRFVRLLRAHFGVAENGIIPFVIKKQLPLKAIGSL